MRKLSILLVVLVIGCNPDRLYPSIRENGNHQYAVCTGSDGSGGNLSLGGLFGYNYEGYLNGWPDNIRTGVNKDYAQCFATKEQADSALQWLVKAETLQEIEREAQCKAHDFEPPWLRVAFPWFLRVAGLSLLVCIISAIYSNNKANKSKTE